MNSLLMVFSSKIYALLAVAVAASFWVLMAQFDQMLFFSPVPAFYIPPDAWISFALSTITAILLGIVVSMNVYVFRTSKVRLGGSLLSGSALGIISSGCAGCTSAGFFLVTAFGIAGVTATNMHNIRCRFVSHRWDYLFGHTTRFTSA